MIKTSGMKEPDTGEVHDGVELVAVFLGDGLDGAEDLCSFGNVNVPVEGLPRPGLGDLSRNFLAILVLDVQRVDYGGLPDKYSDGRCSIPLDEATLIL